MKLKKAKNAIRNVANESQPASNIMQPSATETNSLKTEITLMLIIGGIAVTICAIIIAVLKYL